MLPDSQNLIELLSRLESTCIHPKQRTSQSVPFKQDEMDTLGKLLHMNDPSGCYFLCNRVAENLVDPAAVSFQVRQLRLSQSVDQCDTPGHQRLNDSAHTL